jgi:hypothetical protein
MSSVEQWMSFEEVGVAREEVGHFFVEKGLHGFPIIVHDIYLLKHTRLHEIPHELGGGP